GGDIRTPYGPLGDDAAFRKQFRLAAAIADATGYPFEKLAAIHFLKGFDGLRQVVDRTPPRDQGAQTARDLWHIYNLGNATAAAASKKFLKTMRNRKLDKRALLESYLDAFVTCWEL